MTLGDSDWGKTWATANHRPRADVNDLDFGYEGNIDTFYSRAEKETREYIGKFPDGNPQEKLTAAAKTFNVPVTINGNLTVTGKCVRLWRRLRRRHRRSPPIRVAVGSFS